MESIDYSHQQLSCCNKELLEYAFDASPRLGIIGRKHGSGKSGSSRVKSSNVPEPRNVVLYSRKGCHLCEVVKESLNKLSRRGGFIWREIDVDADAELRRQYNDEVPVVFIDGRKAFKYRMDEQEFLRKLAN